MNKKIENVNSKINKIKENIKINEKKEKKVMKNRKSDIIEIKDKEENKIMEKNKDNEKIE